MERGTASWRTIEGVLDVNGIRGEHEVRIFPERENLI
jgi:hypothetical protein